MENGEVVKARLIELCDTNCGYVDEVPVEQFVGYLIANGVTLKPETTDQSAN
jgi:hypothetical protein